jgi:hypothetical protein
MNKTITISGQTIELPFTEKEYQEILEDNSIDSFVKTFEITANSENLSLKCFNQGIAVGLHLAEKAREDEVNALRKSLIDLGTEYANLKVKYSDWRNYE